MNKNLPYLIGRVGSLELNIGTYAHPKSSAVIFEPVQLQECTILMSEEEGPYIVQNDRRWPVRLYSVTYSLDRLMSMERFRSNPQAIHLYLFERLVSEKVLSRNDINPDSIAKKRKGTPVSIVETFGKLKESALMLPTETSGEYRLFKPYFDALDELKQPSAQHFR